MQEVAYPRLTSKQWLFFIILSLFLLSGYDNSLKAFERNEVQSITYCEDNNRFTISNACLGQHKSSFNCRFVTLKHLSKVSGYYAKNCNGLTMEFDRKGKLIDLTKYFEFSSQPNWGGLRSSLINKYGLPKDTFSNNKSNSSYKNIVQRHLCWGVCVNTSDGDLWKNNKHTISAYYTGSIHRESGEHRYSMVVKTIDMVARKRLSNWQDQLDAERIRKESDLGL